MNRHNPTDLPSVAQRRSNTLRLLVRGGEQVQSTDDQMNRLFDRRLRGFDYLLNGRVTAPDHQYDPLRRIDGQRDLHHVQIDAPRTL